MTYNPDEKMIYNNTYVHKTSLSGVKLYKHEATVIMGMAVNDINALVGLITIFNDSETAVRWSLVSNVNKMTYKRCDAKTSEKVTFYTGPVRIRNFNEKVIKSGVLSANNSYPIEASVLLKKSAIVNLFLIIEPVKPELINAEFDSSILGTINILC